MKLAGIFGILVGLLMLAQWGFFLASGQVPELKSEPYRIAFHLAAELITALGLIASGIALLRKQPWSTAAYLFFSGMLAYSVIASPGYFAQHGQWVLVIMFFGLLVLVAMTVLSFIKKMMSERS